MPVGPNGEKRPANVVANAVHVMRLATGEAEETFINARQSAGGKKGGRARAKTLDPERRRRIAEKAVSGSSQGRGLKR